MSQDGIGLGIFLMYVRVYIYTLKEAHTFTAENQMWYVINSSVDPVPNRGFSPLSFSTHSLTYI